MAQPDGAQERNADALPQADRVERVQLFHVKRLVADHLIKI